MASGSALIHRLLFAGAVLAMAPAEASNRLVQLDTTAWCGRPASLDSPRALSISPDGTSVYAAGDLHDAVLVFARDAGSGNLDVVQEIPSGPGGLAVPASAMASVVSPDGAHAYVADALGHRVYAFARDGLSGALALVGQVTDDVGGVDGLAAVRRLAISPDGAHVYATGTGEDEIAVFARNPITGVLGFVEVQQEGVGGVTGLDEPDDVAVSPDGSHVYVASGAAVLVFARNAGTGALAFLEAEPHGVFQGLNGPHDLVLSPDGLFVHTAGEGPATVAVFARNPMTGALAFVQALDSGLAGGNDVLQLDVSPDGAHLYATNASLDAVFTLTRDPMLGTVSLVQTLSGSGATAVELRVAPDGAHVYALSAADAVVVFDRAVGTGFLTPASVLLDPRDPVAVAVSPGGGQVYAACERGIGVAARDAGSGSLTPVAEVGLAGAGATVTAFTLSPDGATAYVLQDRPGAADALLVFDRDAGTGALTLVEEHVQGVGGVDGLLVGRATAVSPDGEHAYVAGLDAVAIFDRDPSDGTLAFVEAFRPVGPTPDPVQQLQDVVVSADGAQVYAVGGGTVFGKLVHFRRAPATGLLTFVAQFVEGSGGAPSLGDPRSVALGDDDHLYVVSAQDDTVVVFARDPSTGALDEVQAARRLAGGGALGSEPFSVHVDALGRYAYAVSGGRLLDVYRRDAVTGPLASVETLADTDPGNALLAGARDAAPSPDGRHLYVLATAGTIGYGHATVCAPTPAAGCVAATASNVKLQASPSAAKDRLAWKWTGPGPIATGDPPTTTDAALCLYDTSVAPQPVVDASIPAGQTCRTKPCWKTTATGFSYKDPLTTPDGIVAVKIVAGASGVARVTIKGKSTLPPFDLPLADPVTAQLQLSNGTCLEAAYPAAVANDGRKYVAKGP